MMFAKSHFFSQNYIWVREILVSVRQVKVWFAIYNWVRQLKIRQIVRQVALTHYTPPLSTPYS